MDDDLFNFLNDEFPPPNRHSNIVLYESLDKYETNDEYVFTLQFTIDISNDDIQAVATPYWVDISVLGELYTFSFAEHIIPELTKITLRNNILDMQVRKNNYSNKSLTDYIEVMIQ